MKPRRPPALLCLPFFFSLLWVANATSERGNDQHSRSHRAVRSAIPLRDRKTNRHAKSCRRKIPTLAFFTFFTDTCRYVDAFFLPSPRDRPRVRGWRYLASVISRHGLTHKCAALCRRPRRNEDGDATDGE